MPDLALRRWRKTVCGPFSVASWLLAVALFLAACQEGARLPGWLEDSQPAEPPVVEAPPPQPEPEPEPALEVVELTAIEPVEIEVEPLDIVELGPARVGFLVPLTGRGADEGRAMLDAAQIALFDVGETIVLLPRDTKGRPEAAAEAAAAVIGEGAELILGPLFADSVEAVAPLAHDAGINLVAFSTDPRVAGDDSLLIGFTSAQQVVRLVAFARAQGLSRFAVLAPDTAYGQAVVSQYRAAVAGAGAELSRAEFYAPDGSDAQAVVRRLANYDARNGALRAQIAEFEARDDELARQALARLDGLDTLGPAPFDALLIADGGPGLRSVAPLLPYYDIDPNEVRLMGTGLWDDPETLSEPTLLGGWFVSPPPAARERFVARFERIYGERPPRLATLAYDATALAGVLSRFPTGADFSYESLRSSNGFVGVDGVFRFGADGLAERGLAVLEVGAGGSAWVIDEAPTTFQTAAQRAEDSPGSAD